MRPRVYDLSKRMVFLLLSTLSTVATSAFANVGQELVCTGGYIRTKVYHVVEYYGGRPETQLKDNENFALANFTRCLPPVVGNDNLHYTVTTDVNTTDGTPIGKFFLEFSADPSGRPLRPNATFTPIDGENGAYQSDERRGVRFHFQDKGVTNADSNWSRTYQYSSFGVRMQRRNNLNLNCEIRSGPQTKCPGCDLAAQGPGAIQQNGGPQAHGGVPGVIEPPFATTGGFGFSSRGSTGGAK